MLAEKKRLSLACSTEEWLGRAMKSAPFHEAPLTTEIALATSQIVLLHRDPADAFLAATAKVLTLTLVTSDARLLSVQGISLPAN